MICPLFKLHFESNVVIEGNSLSNLSNRPPRKPASFRSMPLIRRPKSFLSTVLNLNVRYEMCICHSFIQSFSHSFSHSVIHSFIHSFIHSYVLMILTFSFIHWFIHSFIAMYWSLWPFCTDECWPLCTYRCTMLRRSVARRRHKVTTAVTTRRNGVCTMTATMMTTMTTLSNPGRNGWTDMKSTHSSERDPSDRYVEKLYRSWSTLACHFRKTQKKIDVFIHRNGQQGPR